VAALAFAWVTFRRWSTGGEQAALVAAIIALAVALGTFAYLLKAPHLHRK
jgi:hypothetical protein